MICSYGTFVPNTFAGSPIGEVEREARLALNSGVRVNCVVAAAAEQRRVAEATRPETGSSEFSRDRLSNRPV